MTRITVKDIIIYLLQQRPLEELSTLVRVVAAIPRDWPTASASDTPIMLIAIARLLHIFATYNMDSWERVWGNINNPEA